MTTVFVNGTFDILHVGHIHLLNYARSLGDILIVGIDSDERVRMLKGFNRPINNEYERATLLKNLKSVTQVELFTTDNQLRELISQCDIMVKGSDYKGKPIIGEDICPSIIFFDRINEYSTTNKIQYVINR